MAIYGALKQSDMTGVIELNLRTECFVLEPNTRNISINRDNDK